MVVEVLASTQRVKSGTTFTVEGQFGGLLSQLTSLQQVEIQKRLDEKSHQDD